MVVVSDTVYKVSDMSGAFSSLRRSGLLWRAFWRALQPLRPACSRSATFLWQIATLAALCRLVASCRRAAAHRPLAGVKVEATLPGQYFMSYLAWEETDANGRFEVFDFPLEPPWFNGNSAARGQMTFTDPNKLRNTIETVYSLNAIEPTNLHLTIRSGYDVRGLLTSSDRPIPCTSLGCFAGSATASSCIGAANKRSPTTNPPPISSPP